MRLNDHVIWIQPNKVNMNEMNCGGWYEWDGLWTEGFKNETWSMKCGLKEMRWNMNNEDDNVTFLSLSLTTFQAGQKKMLHTLFFVCSFVWLKNKSICLFIKEFSLFI